MRVPERKNDYFARMHVVVDVVANAIELEAAKIGILAGCAALADARLNGEELRCSLEVVGYGSGCRRSIRGPPSCCSFKLDQCPRRDFDGKHGRQ